MLYLVRHGQTEANAAGLIQGQRDLDLTPLGRRQAADLAEVVPRAAAVISSPLRRARQTAEALGQHPIRLDPRWAEMDFGDYEGLAVDDVRHIIWPNWERDAEWAPPGGESLAAVSRRVIRACEDLAAQAATDDVIVVTHVSPIKAAVAWALDASPQIAGRMFVEVASVTAIAVRPDGQRVLVSFNGPSPPGTGGRAG